jgi:hypothetical protein
VTVAASDAGSGVDWSSATATVDGKAGSFSVARGHLTVRAAKGRHAVVVTVGDYQEAKNMEDVAKILPNTGRVAATVTVR